MQKITNQNYLLNAYKNYLIMVYVFTNFLLLFIFTSFYN